MDHRALMPIIVLSAISVDADAREAGADVCLQKHYTYRRYSNQLLVCITNVSTRLPRQQGSLKPDLEDEGGDKPGSSKAAEPLVLREWLCNLPFCCWDSR